MAHVSEIYGSMVFNEHVMKERLPSATYKSLTKTIKEGKPLDIEVANVVAHAMKEWAIEHGATHYTHWFQPLSGITSEKHDSFLNPVGAVSYTHLDVYKRQLPCRPEEGWLPHARLPYG